MAKTARGGVCDQPFVGVDQGRFGRPVIRASPLRATGAPRRKAADLGGPVGSFTQLTPTGSHCRTASSAAFWRCRGPALVTAFVNILASCVNAREAITW